MPPTRSCPKSSSADARFATKIISSYKVGFVRGKFTTDKILLFGRFSRSAESANIDFTVAYDIIDQSEQTSFFLKIALKKHGQKL